MSLRTAEEIERAIAGLTARELEKLYAWFDQHYPQLIDDRIKSDLAAGCLDKALHRALEDENSGRARSL